MSDASYTHLNKGCFLIASPEADNGMYARSVVILCEHSTAGSFGLMVNKPLNIDLPDEVAVTKEVSNPHLQIRSGGPVQPTQMMLLHTSNHVNQQTLKLCDGVYLGGDMQFLQEAIANAEGPSVRLCFGYCGWGPGQLEKEFLSGNWFLHPGNSTHVFETNPESIWKAILREMGGKYATLSLIPDDLSLN